MDGWDASVIILASFPLVRTLVDKAIMRSGISFNVNLVEAVVIEDAFPESAGCWASLLGDAVAPTGLVVVAFVLTVLKSSETSRVFRASSGFTWAFFLDAVLRGEDSKSSFSGITKAIVGLSAFSNVYSGLASLGWEAKSPAGDLGSALLHAVIKSRLALGVLKASSPLSGAFSFNASLGISQSNSS